MTDKQKRKTIASIGIFFIMLVGLGIARSMLESSSIPEEYGELVIAAIWIIAIAGVTVVWSR